MISVLTPTGRWEVGKDICLSGIDTTPEAVFFFKKLIKLIDTYIFHQRHRIIKKLGILTGTCAL
jgi:hypothetical protein